MKASIICGKVEDALPRFPRHYFDAIFGDPPYLISFMGRGFDRQHRDHAGENEGQRMQAFHRAWLDAARPKLRPGANVIAASGSRAYHRLASGAEDAGLEILPLFAVIHGQAMAQGADLSKLIDKAAGAEREVIGPDPNYREKCHTPLVMDGGQTRPENITAPATPAAKLWAGWATRLKDAVTPWLMARKPFDGPSYRNALEHGVAGYDIEAGRVPLGGEVLRDPGDSVSSYGTGNERPWESDPTLLAAARTRSRESQARSQAAGRYPSSACLIHAEDCAADACAPGCPIFEMDEQSGHLQSGAMANGKRPGRGAVYGAPAGDRGSTEGDSGGASRFYHQFRYHAKAGRGERMRGCESFFWRVDRNHPLGYVRIGIDEYLAMGHLPGCRPRRRAANEDLPLFDIFASDMADVPEPGCAEGCQHKMRYQGSIHPTLKPIELCRYLAGLILPPPRADGQPRRLLVPFAGTMSEVIGALLAGWDEVVAVESEAVYCELGAARIPAWLEAEDATQGGLWTNWEGGNSVVDCTAPCTTSQERY